MNKWILVLSLLFTNVSYAATDTYADKCAELIEHSKSPTANWTTSIQEAAMAGECLGVIKTITNQIHNLQLRTSRGYTQQYNCKAGSSLESAAIIVDRQANTIEEVVTALCYLD